MNLTDKISTFTTKNNILKHIKLFKKKIHYECARNITDRITKNISKIAQLKVQGLKELQIKRLRITN